MDREIGEIFTYKGKTYQVVKDIICENCSFTYPACYYLKNILGNCCNAARTDETRVIFKEINNMEIENNQLTIDIPKGMEIDIENSRLSEGIIKFKSNDITYDDIINSFNSIACINVCVHSSDINKLKAMAQLMNIARYYNKDWKPNWNNRGEDKYFIIWNNECKAYWTDYNRNSSRNVVYFKNKEDAQSVIDNPNFREILDTIFKN